jgi:hypothetical protein
MRKTVSRIYHLIGRSLKIQFLFTVSLVALVSCGGGSGDKPVKKVNQLPIFTSESNFTSLDGLLELGYSAHASDKDGDHITYNITGGADERHFLIDPTSGVLSFVSKPDFNNPHDENNNNSYEVEITASDNKDGKAKLSLTITITGKRAMLTIPVVVHVLYLENADHVTNISDAKILSQFEVLNRDFRKINADLAKVPEEFKAVIADVGIEFELAKIGPDGEQTTGITRTLDQINGEILSSLPFTAKGGHDAWPTNQYLNIWVHDNSDRHGDVAVAGTGQMPGGDPLTDGVTIDYRVFGTLEPLVSSNKLHLGRTTTHEIGHWLNLRHLGAGNSCDKDDGVEDTPNSITYNSSHPVYPRMSCGSSDMFMNFMNTGVSDEEIIMFSEGQKQRIYAAFVEDESRAELYKTSLNK